MDDKVAAALVPWIRDSDVDNLTHSLEDVLRQNPEAHHASIRWRPNTVIDFRDHRVPAIVERLSRWDLRHPDSIFSHGFWPRSSEQDEWVHDEMDLWTYTQRNVRSIFVGTTRYYRNEAHRATRWTPRDRRNVFEYEILAPGGIDVNLSLQGTNQQFANQHEITFPGGIRREFVRSARQYDEQGHVISIWENGFFLDHYENLAIWNEFADPVCGASLRVLYWTGPGDTESRQLQDITRGAYEDMMGQEGEPMVDDLIHGTCPPEPPRAAFRRPRGSDSESHDFNNEVYFFTANLFARISVKRVSIEPEGHCPVCNRSMSAYSMVLPSHLRNVAGQGRIDDALLYGPRNILAVWPSLQKAGFAGLDAVLPSSNQIDEFYFFSQDKYALIKVIPQTAQDTIINGPHKIVDMWPSLRQAQFTEVDAVLPSPNRGDEAYFFRGDHYALIRFRSGTTDDYIVNGPKVITEEWPSLCRAGFSRVDVAFPSPSERDEAYFFRGDRYVLIKVIPGTKEDYIIDGPHKVANHWSSLHKAGFY